MTDRVIEIRLRAPRPNLLQLLAQPQLSIIREGQGTGPFRIDTRQDSPGAMSLSRTIRVIGVPRSGTNLVKYLLEANTGFRCAKDVN